MAPLPTKAKGGRTGSWRPYDRLRRCKRSRSGLPACLIVTLFAILCGANLKYGSWQSLAKNRGFDPEDKGGDGVLQQGRRCEGLQELEVQDLGCC
jgi:hypothetical protein